MANRGLYEFETDGRNRVVTSPANLERLRRLFRDDQIIDGEWGPGDAGDFDHGSWHILCHLAGGTGVFRAGRDFVWVAITHDAAADLYLATATFRENGQVHTVPLFDTAVQTRLAAARLLGFVEGSSVGHIFARQANDPRAAFNGWPRQDFDRDSADQINNGGTVWEHWCTTRDIRASSAIGDSCLRGYLDLVAVLGGRFVAAVARGRRAHEHPRHLAALVKAGVLDKAEALWRTLPLPIPGAAERLLLEARPADALTAVEQLPWVDGGEPTYFMFARRIDRWSSSEDVQRDFTAHGVA